MDLEPSLSIPPVTSAPYVDWAHQSRHRTSHFVRACRFRRHVPMLGHQGLLAIAACIGVLGAFAVFAIKSVR